MSKRELKGTRRPRAVDSPGPSFNRRGAACRRIAFSKTQCDTICRFLSFSGERARLYGSADQSHGVLPELASWILNRLLFTIEIDGQSILTFDAGHLNEAEQLAASSQLQAHLMSYESTSGRVWDGRGPIRIREALLNEMETWVAVFRANGEAERRCLVWLIPVNDPNARRSPN
jgi:hypothetical protein